MWTGKTIFSDTTFRSKQLYEKKESDKPESILKTNIYLPDKNEIHTQEQYTRTISECCSEWASVTPQVERKEKVMNECWEKPQTCTCNSNALAFLFPSLRGPPEIWHHNWIQLSFKYELSLRGDPLGPYRGKHLPLMNWPYGDTGLYIG